MGKRSNLWKDRMDYWKAAVLFDVLKYCDGDVAATAKELGLSRQHVYKLIRKYRIYE